jgi:hypothetical protein
MIFLKQSNMPLYESAPVPLPVCNCLFHNQLPCIIKVCLLLGDIHSGLNNVQWIPGDLTSVLYNKRLTVQYLLT